MSDIVIADSFFKVGKSHEVCEDYAYSSYEGFAILSDGCSSAPDTDIGSRLLVRKKAEQFRKKLNDDIGLVWSCMDTLKSYGISDYSLTATLGYVIKDDHGFHTVFHGDGVIVARKRDTKDLEVYTVEFPSNAPYYLVYEIKPHDKKNWIENFQSNLVLSRNFISREGIIDSNFYRDEYEVDEDFAGFNHTFSAEEYDMVVLISDGIETFYKIENSSIPYSQPVKKHINHLKMVKDLFKFKDGIDDVFLNKAFSSYMNKSHTRDWYHSDDLSMAGLYCP